MRTTQVLAATSVLVGEAVVIVRNATGGYEERSDD